MEYVEVARAESERGEVVLRRAARPGRPTAAAGAGAARERRVRDGHPRDVAPSARSPRPRSRRSSDPRDVLIGGLGLGFTLHEVLADHAGRARRRGRDRGGAGAVDAGRDRPPRPGAARRRAAAPGRRRHRGRRSARRPRVLRPGAARRRQRPRLPRATRTTPRSTSRPSSPRSRRRCAPAVRSRSGRPTSRPTWPTPWRRSSATSTPVPYDVTLCTRAAGDERYWLYLSASLSTPSVASRTWHGRLPHRARQHGRGRGPRGRPVAGPDPARGRELPDQRRPPSRPSTSRRWPGSRPPPRRSTPSSA